MNQIPLPGVIARSRVSSIYCAGSRQPPRIKGPESRILGETHMIGPTHIRAALAGAAVTALTVGGSPLTASAQTVKIGLINSYSGFLAQAGDQMQKGIDLYVKEHEKD